MKYRFTNLHIRLMPLPDNDKNSKAASSQSLNYGDICDAD